MALDIGIQMDNLGEDDRNIGYALSMFNQDFLDKIKVNKDILLEKDEAKKFKYVPDSFFSEICSYYNKNILGFEKVTSYLKKSEIAFIEREINELCSFSKDIKNLLVNAIKQADVIQDLIDSLSNEKIKLSLKEISKFEHFALYSNVISLEEKVIKPELRGVPFDMLDEDTFTQDASGTEKIWVNSASYKNKHQIEINIEDDFFYLYSEDIKIGLRIGPMVLPFINDLSKFINKDRNINYWYLVFKENLGKPDKKYREDSQLLKNFIALRDESALNKLLSNLKKNLYIDSGIEIPPKYADFFRDFTYVEKLKYLEEYELYMPQAVDDSALGVYATVKKNDNYNLLHWLEHHNEDNFNYFPGPKSEKRGKKLVSVLKPQISFYVLEKYFEDVVAKILNDKEYEFLSNIALTIKGKPKFEVDFLVNTNEKLYFIEAKTKLSKDYIYSYLDNAAKILTIFKARFGDDFDMEFLLLGGFSDTNVDSYQHFVDLMPRDNYNKKREGLNTIPYLFKVPIPNIPGKDILCVAEPEYANMESIISEICPK